MEMGIYYSNASKDVVGAMAIFGYIATVFFVSI
jgi:hypothetical protein